MSNPSLTQITFDFAAEEEVKAAEEEMLTTTTEVAEETPVQEEILSESRGKTETAEQRTLTGEKGTKNR